VYLHLGQNVVVPEDDIIGVFDLDNTTSSRITRDFLAKAENTGRVISVSDELPRSFIVCNENIVYLSQLSPQTLQKRTETMKGILI
jgi:hypothetical protein